jgi:light-regulated signal transduction histidine kinase (bacteriophytochrome)
VDAGLMMLALRNLLSNAVKFSQAQPESQIRFGSTKLQGECVFYVRDNGMGFDSAYAHRLFGAFQRTYADGGLGSQICAGLHGHRNVVG